MRLVRQDGKDWTVYENENEARENNIVGKTLVEARQGDYVRDTYGYYVPVIKFYESINKRGQKVWRWIFPKDNAMRIVKNDNPQFAYVYDPNRNRIKRIPDVKLEVMTKLIIEGADIWDAARIAYGKSFDNKVINSLVTDITFIERIKNSKALMGLKETFKSRGLTEEKLADTLLESLDSESFTEKKWAAEIALKYLEGTPEVTTQKFSMQIEASKINDILSQKIPSVLTQGGEHVLPSSTTTDCAVL